MALVNCTNDNLQYAEVYPGVPLTGEFRINRDENPPACSGQYSMINGVEHVLYRSSGQLFLRVGPREEVIRQPLRCSHSGWASGVAKLDFDWPNGDAQEVVEPIPDWILSDPIFDVIEAWFAIWTFAVAEVMKSQREFDWYHHGYTGR